uniref:NAD(P)H-quinone oxidoreductase subunit 5, chloroplastic n=1 Tax=Campanula patula TaxID=440359 RepID=A0A2K9RLX2_9ASTR|nr:NAD(P)H-quinone oxidoreductase subunit 5 [Campanula patula]
MTQTYQYASIIPLLPLPIPLLLWVGLLLFPVATKSLRRIWVFTSVLLLSLVLVFSINLSIQQINSSFTYQYVWSWIINNDFFLEFGYLMDPLTSIMSILITTVAILVLIYSDNYMFHDRGYLRFFSYMSFFSTSMFGLVTSSNLIQIYIFWELVGICSYLLIGFWFTRPVAANACEKAFVTNRVADFGLLLGILGFYWLTGSFEFRDLFQIFNNFVFNNEGNIFFVTLCAVLLFSGAVAKSAQFPLHVWLPDAMEGPTPISALMHAATMVAAGIFLVARLIPLFRFIPHIMNLISLIGIITVFLGATLALAQKDIKRGLAYSTMSQLGYMMLALGMGSYRSALFHLITHAYSKALLFLGCGSVIHSMQTLVGYSPKKNQNMVLMGGLRKHGPLTKMSFLLGTLSLCGIPPLGCFWSKDEILNDSWLYSPIFALIAWSTAGLTGFYMLRIYLLTFEGHLNVDLQNYSGQKNTSIYSVSLWGKERATVNKIDLPLLTLLTMKNNYGASFFAKKLYQLNQNTRKINQTFITIYDFRNKNIFAYPDESDNNILFPILLLVVFTLFIGFLGIPFNGLDILSKWLRPSINLFHQKTNLTDWPEFLKDGVFSVSLAYLGIILAFFFYKPLYSSLTNYNFINFFVKKNLKILVSDQLINGIYDWSNNRGYIDVFYATYFLGGIRRLSELTDFFDRQVVDGITNGVGLMNFGLGEVIKFLGGGRISSYLFLSCSYISIVLLIFSLLSRN